MKNRSLSSGLFLVFLLLAVIFPLAGSAEELAKLELKVHFIDVGQGDAIFLELPSQQTALIDGGKTSAGATVVKYLNSLGITQIDHLIATHPHEDHIGGLIAVIQEFSIGKVYMPRAVHTTRTYENLLLAIQAKNLRITAVKSGVEANLGPEVKAIFVAPKEDDYANLNNFSAALKVMYGTTNFLFTGDAEALSEREMIAGKENIQADLLKVGHHGSNTSTTQEFIEAVDPKIAVISLGKGNVYEHPHQEVITRLINYGVDIYRTDQNETIIVTSDGDKLTIFPKKESPAQIGDKAPEVIQYIGNKNTKKFHLPTCSGLPAEHNRIYFKSRAEAAKAGQDPCKICKP